MRIWYDTEFHDSGRIIDLISIGMVSEDGREYYAVNDDADWLAISKHDWLPENVVTHLPTVVDAVGANPAFQTYFDRADRSVTFVKPKWVIANEVRDFILSTPSPELWAYYSSHDHVALTQLWGPLTKAPAGIPWRTNDLKQELERWGNPDLPEQVDEHNALADAKWNREVGILLDDLERLTNNALADTWGDTW